MTVLVRGGTVVNATGAAPADVLIEGEKVVALADPASGIAAGWAESAERVVDATGKFVVPGGIDAHTHFELPFGGTTASDDFEIGTRAAAWGGTTTVVDFAVQRASPPGGPSTPTSRRPRAAAPSTTASTSSSATSPRRA